MKLITVTIFFGLLLIGSTNASENTGEAKKDNKQLTSLHKTERIVFSTRHGDLVLALYPNLAPNHVKKFQRLVELGLYDRTYVARVIDGFVFQFSEIHKKPSQLSKAQAAALQPTKAEFTQQVKHKRGIISMAHKDGEPDSAVSSFSVLLGDAPHLDGKYTIIGELESGWTVINKVLASPIKGTVPRDWVYVDKAYIVSDIDAYYAGSAAQ